MAQMGQYNSSLTFPFEDRLVYCTLQTWRNVALLATPGGAEGPLESREAGAAEKHVMVT